MEGPGELNRVHRDMHCAGDRDRSAVRVQGLI